MRRTPLLAIGLALLLVAPMAASTAGLFSIGSTQDHEEGPPTSFEATLPAGVYIENDENHTTNVALPTSGDPAEVGRWLGPIEGEAPAVNLAVLPDGRVMYYSGVEARSADETSPTDLTFMVGDFPIDARSRVMDISVSTNEAGEPVLVNDVSTPSPENGGNIDLFCSGTSIAPDGTVVTTGGTDWYTLDMEPPQNTLTPLKGSDQTQLFHIGEDQEPDRWTDGAKMGVDRWYPSAIQLGDGRTMVASGIQTLAQPQTHNTLIEVYDPATDSYQEIEPTLQFADGVEVGQLYEQPGETGYPSIDETHDRIPNLPMYPRLFTIPSGPNEGDVFYSTAGDLWGPFGEHPVQPLWSALQTFDAQTGTWTVHEPSAYGARQLAASVPLMLDPAEDHAARVLTFGGTLQQGFVATNTAEIADLSGSAPTAEPTEAMHLPRWHVNGVLLPNGQVMAVGGGLYDNVVMHGAPEVAMLNGELYNPDTGTWEPTAPMEEPRVYHSTAVLLPDGRVLTGGHVPLPAFHEHQREQLNPQVTDSTFEVYEPPYLFLDDDRPEILGGQVAASYGDDVQVEVTGLDGGAEGLHSAVLMRPGATTHGFDADQRGIELTVGSAEDMPGGVTTLELNMPANGNLAPPGYYMLFVNEDVDGQAMPSEAIFVHLT